MDKIHRYANKRNLNDSKYHKGISPRYYRGSRRGSHRGRGSWGEWNFQKNNFRKTHSINNIEENTNSRAESPIEGSEEYQKRKIEKTSALIMRHLLSPNESVISNSNGMASSEPSIIAVQQSKNNGNSEKSMDNFVNHVTSAKSSAREIRDQLMKYITKLNDGRRKNFINTKSNSWDNAINNIQKQKRLEISRVLRSMNSKSSSTNNSTDPEDSIVADIGINLEELPKDVIEELKRTLHLDLETIDGEMDDSTLIRDDMTRNHISIENLTSSDKDSVQSGETKNLKSFLDRFQKPPNFYSKNQHSHENLQETIDIKDENERAVKSNLNDSLDMFLQTTDHLEIDCNGKYDNNLSHQKESSSQCTSDNMESIILQIIKQDKCLKLENIADIIEKADIVEKCIEHLTGYRRWLTDCILNCVNTNINNTLSDIKSSNNSTSQRSSLNTSDKEIVDQKNAHDRKKRRKIDVECHKTDTKEDIIQSSEFFIQFPVIEEQITFIEIVNEFLILSTHSGDILYLSLTDGSIQHRIDVTSSTITSLSFIRGLNGQIDMYIGSLEEVFRAYDFNKKTLLRTTSINDQIKCMDSMWNFVFLGCKNGSLMRYSCDKRKIEFNDEPTMGKEILMLKAGQEGPRKVLVLSYRQTPIYIKDAMSGLYLRSFNIEASTPTVYSLVIYKNNLYCGTAKNNVWVFSFHDGILRQEIIPDDGKGVSCLKIRKNFLFVGCYNGCIYIYNLEDNKLLHSLNCKQGSIASMEVLSKQVVFGTLSGVFGSVELPDNLFLRKNV